MDSEKPGAKSLHDGHRRRLRHRFLQAPETLPDYELLELLLFSTSSRADTKPLAKRLIEHFGTLAAVLQADPKRFKEVAGAQSEAVQACLLSTREAAIRLARAEITDRPAIGSWQQLIDYCQLTLGHSPDEEFHLLFLDRKNRLIRDEVQQKGTIDHAPVYPREVVKRALELGASAIIMVHNHPSGDPTPSRADIEITRAVRDAGKAVGIVLHDHVIVARGRHASMKNMSLI